MRNSAKIVYEDRILAYVDVLGWRELIRDSRKDPAVMTRIGGAVDKLRNTGRFVRRWKPTATRVGRLDLLPEATVFSDTAVVSCAVKVDALEVLLHQVRGFCVALLLDGLLTRGAIVRGQLHHRNDVIIGPALVDAYLIESTVAKYPRIVIDDPLQPNAIQGLPQGNVTLPPEALLEDRDSLKILNFFYDGPDNEVFTMPELIPSIRARVASDLAHDHSDLSIRAKRGWMLKYLDRAHRKTKRKNV